VLNKIIIALLTLALSLGIHSPAFAATPNVEITTTLAVIIAPEEYTELKELGSGYPGEVGAKLKADAVSEVFKDRVDKLIVLTKRDETTKKSIIKTLSTLAYSDHYDHVIVVWMGWSMKGLLVREGKTMYRDASSLLLCSDVDISVMDGKLSSLEYGAVSPLEIQTMLESIGERQTVILDVNRDSGLYARQTAGSQILIRFTGLSSRDWPRSERTTVLSPTESEVGEANDFALAMRDILRGLKEDVSYEKLAEKLRQANMGPDKKTLPVPVYYGYKAKGADIFLKEAPRPPELEPPKVKPLFSEIVPENPLNLPPGLKPIGQPIGPDAIGRPEEKSPWLGPVSLAAGGICLAAGAITAGAYANVYSKAAAAETGQEYDKYVGPANTLGGLTIGFASCAAVGGTVGTLRLTGKF